MKQVQLKEYLTASGENPFRQWLEGVDIKIKARIQARLLRFEEGNLGDHKLVGKRIWEARLHFGAGYRVYFGKDGINIILLLLGGSKSSQSKDIRKAQHYWDDYQRKVKP